MVLAEIWGVKDIPMMTMGFCLQNVTVTEGEIDRWSGAALAIPYGTAYTLKRPGTRTVTIRLKVRVNTFRKILVDPLILKLVKF